MKLTCRITGKIGIFVLLFAFIFVPVSANMAVAAEAEAGAQGNPGPGGLSQLSEAQLAALAGASLVIFAVTANALTDDDTNATAQHTPSAPAPPAD